MPKERPAPPTVRSRRLAFELRRLREAAGLTRDQVSEETGVNPATLYRHETGSGGTRPQRRTMIALLNLYGASDEQRADLMALSREADVQTWLQPYHKELPEHYTAYISFEAEARTVRNYESLFIPGLLQTEDYARAVIATAWFNQPHETDQLVRFRKERQTFLTRQPDPLELWVVLEESALRRPVGGREVMAAQLRHLAETVTMPNVTLQIMPTAKGAHVAMAGPFSLLEFQPHASTVVYVESAAGNVYLEKERDVRTFVQTFDLLRATAPDPQEALALLEQLTREMQES